jgi:uncharacterized protein (TIGR00255 family)
MALSSMTGFARVSGVSFGYVWTWELKSVNGKGLEVRLRLPPGWDALEASARARARNLLARGTVHGTLSLRREGGPPAVRVNADVLAAVLATMREVSLRVDAAPPSLDGILALKGVIEAVDEDERDEDRRSAEAAIIEGFDRATVDLVGMRRQEGDGLGQLLSTRLSEMRVLVQRAEAAPGRRPEAIKERLSELVRTLLDSTEQFDPDRLHQEAVLIASKADVREELDRLAAHIDQSADLLVRGGAVGRKLDFLAQELYREANTLCAKSNDIELTNIGLELKSVVEQFREQVQNLE